MRLSQFPLKKFFERLYNKALDEDIFSSAAQVAFYFSFAIFPLLLFLVSLFGMVLSSADDIRAELFFYLRQIMPYSAFDVVKGTIDEITNKSSGSKLTFGFFIALWSASAGIDSIRVGLNSVYNLKEKRAWWKTKLLSLLFTVVITSMISIALLIIFYGWKLVEFVLLSISVPVPEGYLLFAIQSVAVIILLLLVFDLIYSFVPSHSPFRWVWVTPGAITGIILWLLLSGCFRLYLNYYNTYSRMYGSLGAVIILMLWLYLTSLVILIGGSVNSVLYEMRKAADKDVTGENSEDSNNAGGKID
ncbi:MAG: YihY/virulence factor BrkB family protein [Pyrinomonadaceae bacterium]|nr:YihY/virulence factor BrkB family protein [Pyrinomonadaceae bacterium]